MSNKIPHDELIKIFNRVLDSCPFFVNVFDEMHTCRRRKNKRHKSYFENKLFDIECKLEVFENIPKNKIYTVMEDFIEELEDYDKSKNIKKINAKKLQNTSYKLIQKDIKIIEAYQKMIFDYSSDNSYNDDKDFAVLTPELDEVYDFNQRLLIELKTKNFEILDPYRYGGVKLYDSTKKRLKHFFKEVGKRWKVSTHFAKEMIDIL